MRQRKGIEERRKWSRTSRSFVTFAAKDTTVQLQSGRGGVRVTAESPAFTTAFGFLAFLQQAPPPPSSTASFAPHLRPFRPIVLAWLREKLKELGRRMLPNGRAAPNAAIPGIVMCSSETERDCAFRSSGRKRLTSEATCGNRPKPKGGLRQFFPLLCLCLSFIYFFLTPRF